MFVKKSIKSHVSSKLLLLFILKNEMSDARFGPVLVVVTHDMRTRKKEAPKNNVQFLFKVLARHHVFANIG